MPMHMRVTAISAADQMIKGTVSTVKVVSWDYRVSVGKLTCVIGCKAGCNFVGADNATDSSAMTCQRSRQTKVDRYLHYTEAHTGSDCDLLPVLHVQAPDEDPRENSEEKVDDSTPYCSEESAKGGWKRVAL